MPWTRMADQERWVQGDLQPDLTLYFDLAPEIGRALLDKNIGRTVEFIRQAIASR